MTRIITGVVLTIFASCGCGHGTHTDDQAKLIAELATRSQYGVGKSIKKARKAIGLPSFTWGEVYGNCYVLIYLIGPQSVDGTVAVSTGELQRLTVFSMQKLVGSRESGVVIQAVLVGTEWPDRLQLTYSEDGVVYRASAQLSSDLGSVYALYPKSLNLSEKRPLESDVVASEKGDYLSKKQLIGTEAIDGKLVYYYESGEPETKNHIVSEP